MYHPISANKSDTGIVPNLTNTAKSCLLFNSLNSGNKIIAKLR